MNLFIAGAINGNLGRWFYDDIIGQMQIYLAGNFCYVKEKQFWLTRTEDFYKRLNVLESFYYIKDWQLPLIHKFKNFMLDSGVHTFIMGDHKMTKKEYQDYTYRYCEFINENRVKYFVEMDVDIMTDVKFASKLRKIIEKETEAKPIWVLQKGRSKEMFIDALHEYDYFALPISGKIPYAAARRKMKNEINAICDLIHQHGKLAHGLGFSTNRLEEYRLDSVDSTAWTFGNRGKFIYEFMNGRMLKHRMTAIQNRIKPRETAIHNFMQWVLWSEHLEKVKHNRIYLAGSHSKKYLYGVE